MKNKRRTFRSQIISIFLLTFSLTFLVNAVIFSNMKSVIDNVDGAYDGNRSLMEIRDELDSLQLDMQQYIDAKDENILNKFYKDADVYKELIANYKHEAPDTELAIRENSLYNLSERYIQTVNQAVIAKKARHIEKYQEYQSKANREYGYLSSYMAELNNNLFYNNSVTYKNLLSLTEFTELLYMAILLLTGGIAICLLLFFTRRLTEPLRKLADAAIEVGQGNLEIEPVDTDEVNEIGIVNRSFNQMVKSLKEYIEKFRKSVEAESALREKSIRMEASMKDAELKALQAQIDPHFLFNTLNAGAQLAMMENADKTYSYIHKVADFFRFKIKKDEHMSTLSEEIKLVDDYIYILNVRYSGEIHYEKNVDESLLGVCLPSMIIQPVVENCIKHGLSEVDWEKKIDLSVTSEGDNIVISVRDNGVGIPDDIIKRIIRGENMEDVYEEKAGGIGLDNVIMRLRTFYNVEDVIEITSVGENMGTEVALFIPREAMGR